MFYVNLSIFLISIKSLTSSVTISSLKWSFNISIDSLVMDEYNWLVWLKCLSYVIFGLSVFSTLIQTSVFGWPIDISLPLCWILTTLPIVRFNSGIIKGVPICNLPFKIDTPKIKGAFLLYIFFGKILRIHGKTALCLWLSLRSLITSSLYLINWSNKW